jgi:tetratricopeptide (TPR) repeat protein
MVYPRGSAAKRPERGDLRWYEAALRAIPIFVRDHLRPDDRGDFLPAEASLSVATHAGPVNVQVRYPAGTLPGESRPVQSADWPRLQDREEEDLPAFDRRAMEGMLAHVAGGLGGRRKGKAAVEQAQDLMYQAWEERDPNQRIILAREALEISADCADAYVLLAEEEADTLGRALEYYQQGVTAGERALGKAYFKENAGDFWGLLETRPYMRARQGLADTLWQLGRREEALVHYRELLRLNPGDNQGIRYLLLHAWLALNRDDEARALLDQYAGDGTAEWLYSRVLLAFRAGGASQAAEAALQAAIEQNPHVPAYLTGRKRIPSRLPSYIGWGDDREAAAYASAYLPDWRRTPGAVDWLQRHVTAAPAAKPLPLAGKGRRRKRSARSKS